MRKRPGYTQDSVKQLSNKTAEAKPFFYGWVIACVAFLVQGIGFGSQYINGLFIEPLSQMFNASTSTVLFATVSTMTLVTGLASPLCGLLIQRFSLRVFILVAIALVGFGYIGLAYATALWQVSLIYAVCFAVGALAGTLASNTLVSNWFVTGRGPALGFAATGVSAAGCVIPPIATYAIGEFGFRWTCLLMAAGILPLIPIIGYFIVDKPEQMHLLPDGGAASDLPSSAGRNNHGSRRTLWQVFSTPMFWLISIIAALTTAIVGVLIVELMPFAQSVGIQRQDASYLLSCSAAASIAGTVGFGFLGHLFNQRNLVYLFLGILALCCLLLLGYQNYPGIAAASVLLGVALGASSVVPFLLIGINFGREAFALAAGAMNPFLVLIYITILPLTGVMFDHFGSYNQIVELFMVLLAVCAAVAYFLPKKKETDLQG